MDSGAGSVEADVPAGLALGQNFPPATLDDWQARAGAVLSRRGSSVDVDPMTALGTVTEDGITLRPLYVAGEPAPLIGAPGRAPFLRSSTADPTDGWDVRALHRDPDPVRTNAAVLADLESGVTSLWLAVGERGLAVDDLPQALDGVDLARVPIVLDAGAQAGAAARTLLALADDRKVPRRLLAGSLGADPIAARARFGNPADLDEMAELASLVALTAGSRLCAVTVDGTVYNDAGGSDTDELAAVASAGVAYLRALSAAGIDDPFAQLEFRYAVGDDQFNGIAKLRAARRIWSRIGQLCGVSAGQRQHAVTSSAMMTRRDPWVNVLRTTIGCFSAAAGGAQAITVRPFDDALGLPDDFARRIARNTQAVIHGESHLGRVVDPAGGSWYVETLSEQLAAVAWKKFTALERAGGALAALDSGFLATMLASSAGERAVRIDTRTRLITGVTAFPDLSEAVVKRPAAPPPAHGGLLPSMRYAQRFEALRDRAEAAGAASSGPARVVLATLGSAASWAARVGFARELFAVAGLETVTVDLDGAPLLDDVGAVACLCSSDVEYAERGAAAVSALRAAGATHVVVAGRPDSGLGADDFVFAGCKAYAVLAKTLDRVEAQR